MKIFLGILILINLLFANMNNDNAYLKGRYFASNQGSIVDTIVDEKGTYEGCKELFIEFGSIKTNFRYAKDWIEGCSSVINQGRRY